MNVTRTRDNRSIHRTHIQTYGGFRDYWKLYPTLLKQLGAINKITPNSWLKVGLNLIFSLKTPWWLILKPLGVTFFSVKTISKGQYIRETTTGSAYYKDSTSILLNNMVESKTFRFFGVPFFGFTRNIPDSRLREFDKN